MAKAALEKGKDVYVEKPLALEMEHANELQELAEKNKRILMVGHILHYHPAVQKIKELISNGELGRIQYIYSNRISLGKIRREENILWSFAPHDISLITSILKELPEQVHTMGGAFLHEKIADITMTSMKYASGVRAHIFVSWLHPFKEQRLVIVGDKKMLVFNDVEPKDKILIYPHEIEWKNNMPVPDKKEAISVPFESFEPLKQECLAFLNSIETRVPPLTDGKEGIRTLQILKACQGSLEQNKIIFLSHKPETKNKANTFFSHPTAVIDNGAKIGKGTKIWHFSHIMKNAQIGGNCNLGQNVVVSPNVVLGNNVKIQNNVSVYTGCILEDDVFCGPSMVFTNINTPRSHIVRRHLYEKTLVKKGAALGANSTIICGVTIGKYAFVGAGAVVTKDILDYALVIGNPARISGWRCDCGGGIQFVENNGTCKECKKNYAMENETTVLPEDSIKTN